MRIGKLFIGIFLMLSTLLAFANESAYVIVAPSEGYATTYMALPEGFPVERRGQVRRSCAS